MPLIFQVLGPDSQFWPSHLNRHFAPKSPDVVNYKSPMLYAHDLFKELMRVPELSTVGSPQERGAFTGLRVEGRTVREVGQAIGVSKSHVTNLADRFQAKLIKRMKELKRKPPSTCSMEYRNACQGLYERLRELHDFYDDKGLYKIGNFTPGLGSKEDWAECTGINLRLDDD